MKRSVMKTPLGRLRFAGEASTWWPVLLAAACFVLARPYEGFVHDARLYVGYAVAPLDPEGIGADLMFHLDGQSSRTLFPAILRAFAQVLSPSLAALSITTVSLMLWFGGAWRLIRALWAHLSLAETAAFLILATTIHTTYGGSSTFHYAEPFASPRVLAEATVLWAMAQAVRRRWLAASLCLLGALVIHPLMAVAGVSVVTWLAVSSVRLRGALIALSIAGTAAVVVLTTDASNAGGLVRAFDPEWLRVLNQMGTLTFPSNWDVIDWSRITVHLCTVAMGWTLLPKGSTQVVTGTVLAAVGGVAITFAGADLAHNVLVTQIQPWRTLWLLALVASVLLGVILHGALRAARAPYTHSGGYRQVATAMLLLSWYMLATSTAAATLASLALLCWWLPVVRPSFRLSPRVVSATVRVAVIMLLAMAYLEAKVIWEVYAASPDEALLWYWPTAVRAGVMRLSGIVLALWLLRTPTATEVPMGPTIDVERLASPAPTLVRYAASASLLIAAVWVFDARSAFERSLEEHLDARVANGESPAPGALVTDLPPGPVFWPDGEMEPWAFFGRAGYVSAIQGMPRVFSRSLALAWAERRRRILGLEVVPRDTRYRLALGRLYDTSGAGIRTLCSEPDAPATVVLWRRPTWAGQVRVYRLPAAQLLPGQDPGVPWEIRSVMYLITCDSVRTAATTRI